MATITWEPKQAALRDLILLALHHCEGHELKSDDGKVSALLLVECGIPHSAGAVKLASRVSQLMEKGGFVVRDVISRRTHAIRLRTPLDAMRVKLLQGKEAENRRYFTREVAPSAQSLHGEWFTPLYDDCVKALKQLRKKASAAEVTLSSGLVALSGSEALRLAGITDKKRSEEVRYYLKCLKLARAVRKYENDLFLWCWKVDPDKEVDKEKLYKLATGQQSFTAKRTRAAMAGEVTVRRVTPAPGVSQAEPEAAELPLPEPEPVDEEARLVQPEEAVASSEIDDPMEKMASIVEELEQRLEELGRLLQQAQEAATERERVHREAIDELTRKHKEELDVLKQKVQELELAARPARATSRVRRIIERYM